jgi:hypothetical protein
MNNQVWVDILPPSPPTEILSWWLWLTIAIISFLLLAAIYLWYRSPQQQALRELKSIKHKLNSNNTKQVPLGISDILKLRFNVNDINQIKVKEQAKWHNYKQQLTLLCFSKNTPHRDEVEKLLSETRYWLTSK